MQLIFLICACIAVSNARIFVNNVPSNQFEVSPRIVNGEEVKPHSIPYQVWIKLRKDTEDSDCGGVLISNNYVLTAGHCGRGAISAEVTLGAHNIREEEDTQVILRSKSITLHKDNEELENDISIIELEKSVIFTESIQPAKLPSLEDVNKTYVGQRARVSGWGLTKGGTDDISPVLLAEESVVISNSECEYTFDIVDSNICTSGANDKSTCNGDSGGPLTDVDDGTLIGLVSFGESKCVPGYPDVFVRVTHYLEWIQDHSDVTLE